jgi:hypothetical protein
MQKQSQAQFSVPEQANQNQAEDADDGSYG